ncbi:2-acyl-glycerophospho-ethanolamine acyltransferase [Aquisphaera giovannonii]|uniref:2-acyl-glycerophospho-ethanolamine acyltransferase n=1 Tax=Aquisphaera giovannonii TaxID=406548 RepID=A0A5B9VXR9_9BACT|nr:1-acyl-sn-glycerol-3-phosphate acyltransferase [Aquisphaera giovannonii]QEH32681.1 2-acyl-glycerophospho-ethanolamine acyltransferase [Aquisphaera giovannonii]
MGWGDTGAMTVLLYVAAALAGGLVLLVAFLFSLHWLVQPLLRLILSARYRFVVLGAGNVPRRGAALVAMNHISWLDGPMLAATCPRRGNALVGEAYVDVPLLGRWARWIGLVPVPSSGPRARRVLIEECRKLLDRGEVLGLFPEAQISRNGLTGPFHRGLEVILAGREDVAVIPAFIHNMWGSNFSFSGGRFFGKKRQGLRRPVVIAFGPPVPRPVTLFAVRQAVLEAGVAAVEGLGCGRPALETIDPALGHLEHPELGPLTGSTPDIVHGGVSQAGRKEGSVGRPLPGVAIRAVDDSGAAVDPGVSGRLEARVAGRPGWRATGWEGSVDADGFVRIRRE